MILDCNEIIPDRLWVGSLIRLEEVDRLKRMGITTIVSLQSDDDLQFYKIPEKKILKAYEAAQIEFSRVPTRDFDRESLAENLPRCVAELEAALAPLWARVYLHCSAGVNRSPTTAAAYLIRSRGLSPEGAYDYVTARRHCSPDLDLLSRYAAALATSPAAAIEAVDPE